LQKKAMNNVLFTLSEIKKKLDQKLYRCKFLNKLCNSMYKKDSKSESL
jgi:hypothetical protein